MKLLLVSHYFPPEIGAPQRRLSELARYWTEEGDDVTVLTGMPNHPTGIVPEEYRGKLRVEECLNGYRILRTWLYATPNDGFVKKSLGHLSFMLSSVLLGWRKSGPADVVIVSSPTFFSIFSGCLLAWMKRARFVVEVRDLWPAIFIELGVLTNQVVIKVLEALEMAAYRAADSVVVVSEGFRENLIARGVPEEKVFTVRNGVDLERFTADGSAAEDVRRRLGATNGQTVVLYIGAHGISHGLSSIADAAALLRDDHIHISFVGEGAAKRELHAHVRSLGLTNVSLLEGIPSESVAEILSVADVCLVPLRDVPLFGTFIPSKIFELFAAGKAVVGSVRGEAARILGEGGAVVVEPENAAAIADAIRSLAADPERRRVMGRRAREYVGANFDRRDLAKEYRDILEGKGMVRFR